MDHWAAVLFWTRLGERAIFSTPKSSNIEWESHIVQLNNCGLFNSLSLVFGIYVVIAKYYVWAEDDSSNVYGCFWIELFIWRWFACAPEKVLLLWLNFFVLESPTHCKRKIIVSYFELPTQNTREKGCPFSSFYEWHQWEQMSSKYFQSKCITYLYLIHLIHH